MTWIFEVLMLGNLEQLFEVLGIHCLKLQFEPKTYNFLKILNLLFEISVAQTIIEFTV